MVKSRKILTENAFKSYKLIYDVEGNLLTGLELLYALKMWRKSVMDKTHLPSTYIFYNSCLVAFATYYPQTREQFLKVYGVGVKKWEQYGKVITKIIADHLDNKLYGIDDTIPF